MQVSPYSQQVVEELLRLKGFCMEPAELQPTTDLDKHCYIYAYQAFMNWNKECLLKDTVNYFLAINKNPIQRRVCFLLIPKDQRPLAIILEYSYINQQALSSIKQRVQQNNHNNLSTEFRRLYDNIRVWVLTSQNQLESTRQTVKAVLDNTFQTNQAIELNFIDVSYDHCGVLLVENISNLLRNGQVSTVNIQQSSVQHLQQSRQTLCDSLQKLQDSNNKLYSKITELILILMKYALLVQQRQRLQLPESNITLASIEHLQQCDQLMKKQASQNKITWQQAVNSLSLTTIVPLIVKCDQPEEVLRLLKVEQQRYHQLLQQWQQQWEICYQQLIENRLHYFRYKSYLLLKIAHRNRCIGLSAKLCYWLGKKF